MVSCTVNTFSCGYHAAIPLHVLHVRLSVRPSVCLSVSPVRPPDLTKMRRKGKVAVNVPRGISNRCASFRLRRSNVGQGYRMSNHPPPWVTPCSGRRTAAACRHKAWRHVWENWCDNQCSRTFSCRHLDGSIGQWLILGRGMPLLVPHRRSWLMTVVAVQTVETLRLFWHRRNISSKKFRKAGYCYRNGLQKLQKTLSFSRDPPTTLLGGLQCSPKLHSWWGWDSLPLPPKYFFPRRPFASCFGPRASVAPPSKKF